MKNRLLYLIGIAGNFLLLIYAVILIVGIGGGWLDRELESGDNDKKLLK